MSFELEAAARPRPTLRNLEASIVEFKYHVVERRINQPATDNRWNIVWLVGSLAVNVCLCYLLSLWLDGSL